MTKGQLDYMNGLFWIACIVTPGLIYAVLYFLFIELTRLTVTDTGIIITHLITKNQKEISFRDIKKFSMRIISSWSPDSGKITDGFQELEIELTNGQIVSFNQDKFSNYYELKDLIYQYSKK
jgi:hypothetical protein